RFGARSGLRTGARSLCIGTVASGVGGSRCGFRRRFGRNLGFGFGLFGPAALGVALGRLGGDALLPLRRTRRALRLLHALHEALDLAGGVDDALLAGVER